MFCQVLFEFDDCHLTASWDRGIWWNYGQAISRNHRAKDAGTLLTGEPSAVPAGGRGESDPEVSPAPPRVGDWRKGLGLNRRPVE